MSGSSSSSLHEIASRWESATEAERTPLRTLVESLVRYPCKLAAMPLEDGSIHLIVFSVAAGAVKDYLELQSSGAIGVVFHLYDDPDSDVVVSLSDACDDHNEVTGTDFESDSESGSESGSSDDTKED
jgi:hypothetical protein